MKKMFVFLAAVVMFCGCHKEGNPESLVGTKWKASIPEMPSLILKFSQSDVTFIQTRRNGTESTFTGKYTYDPPTVTLNMDAEISLVVNPGKVRGNSLTVAGVFESLDLVMADVIFKRQ